MSTNETRTGEKIRAGDTRTFDRLYADLGPRLLGYLIRLTGDRTDAEDLVQETFAAAYAGRHGYAGRARPLTWLIAIARRRWRDGQRREKPPQGELDENTTSHPGDSRDTVGDSVARSTTLEWAISQLDPAQQEVVTLVLVEGLSYREASAITGDPVGTVGWRLSEATRKLRKLLDTGEAKCEGDYENPEVRKLARAHPSLPQR